MSQRKCKRRLPLLKKKLLKEMDQVRKVRMVKLLKRIVEQRGTVVKCRTRIRSQKMR